MLNLVQGKKWNICMRLRQYWGYSVLQATLTKVMLYNNFNLLEKLVNDIL